MRFLIFALLASIASAEPLFFTLTKADTNYIVLTETPRYGVVVYKKVNGRFEKITTEPVKPLDDPSLVPKILGDDYEKILEITSSLDAEQLLRKLKHNKFQGGILSMTDIRVAQMLGRIIKDAPIKRGESYTYRVVFLRFNGKESDYQDKRTYRATEILPEPPEKLAAEAKDRKVIIRWDYPVWKCDPQDLVVSFKVYRKVRGEKSFTKINHGPILRQNEGRMEFIDQWVENGKTYEYRVSGVDLIGREGKLSNPVDVTPVDRTPPSPPTGLVVLDGHGKAILKWNYALDFDAAGYNVYRSELIGGDYKRVNDKMISFDKPYFIDSTVIPGRHFYKVSTIDSAGNEGKKSNPIMAIIRDSMPPEPPTGISAIYRNGQIEISWEPSHSKDLRGYYVYRGTIRDRLPKIVKLPLDVKILNYTDRGYEDRGFSGGHKYFVGVTAIDSSRNESRMAVVEVTIPDSEPPMPPEFVQVKSTKEGFLRVKFMSSPSMDVSIYRVYRTDMKNTLAELKKTTYIDSSVEKGKTYTYEVTAVDTAGNESKRMKSKPVVARDREAPQAPSDVKGFYNGQGVRLTWNASASQDVSGYNIYKSDLPNGRYTKVNENPIKANEFFDKNGKEFYFYRISAVDHSGNETLSPRVRPIKEKK